jgi:hypothetical protein
VLIAPGPVDDPPAAGPREPSSFDIAAGLNATVGFDGAIGIIGPFIVPGLLAAGSGLLLILLMLAQAVGTLVWLPVVRRRVGSFGFGRR